MPDSNTSDSIYYAHGMKLPLSQRLAIYARRRMLDHFMRVMHPHPTSTIMDFGVSEEITDEANILEQHYPYPERITCLGIGSGEVIRAAYPKIQYRNIKPHAPLPFGPQEFEIAFSNAVFEHLGSDENRRQTLKNLLTVAKRIYVTVPNRWFPVEHHTGVPLLHYSPPLFRRTVAGTQLNYWADPQNMDFMTRQRLRALCPPDRAFRIEYTGIFLGPLSSNIALWTP
jgi:hypothetical protein